MSALLILPALLCALSAQEPDIRIRERVDVERVLVDVRIVDRGGRAIAGLTPADLRVKVDGTPVALESVIWVPGAAPVEPRAAESSAASADAAPTAVEPEATSAGRLIVFFFQRGFEPYRLKGLMQMQRQAEKLLATLAPEDQAAVLIHDSRLKLLLDFTRDRERLRAVVAEAIRLPEARYQTLQEPPSLAEHFDRTAARKAATPEKALLVTARALEPLPGAKTIVFLGWGLGRFVPGMGVFMQYGYEEAARTLARARTSVFALDVADADYHTLEVGLQQVAADTGGFYARTHNFPVLAIERVERALAGHYLLAFERPPGPPGEHRLEIDLVGRKGEVLARPFYEDRPES